MTLLSSRVWHLSIRKWTSNCFSHQERSVAIPLVARETEEKGLSPLGPLHLTNTAQIWKVALSRGSGYTAGFEVACQGLGGSAGPKSGPDLPHGVLAEGRQWWRGQEWAEDTVEGWDSGSPPSLWKSSLLRVQYETGVLEGAIVGSALCLGVWDF